MLDWMFGSVKPRDWFRKKKQSDTPTEIQTDLNLDQEPSASVSSLSSVMSYIPSMPNMATIANITSLSIGDTTDIGKTHLEVSLEEWIPDTTDRQLLLNSLRLAYQGLGEEVRMGLIFDADEGVSDIWFVIIREIFEENFPGSTTDQLDHVGPSTRLLIEANGPNSRKNTVVGLQAIAKHALQMTSLGRIFKPQAVCLVRRSRHQAFSIGNLRYIPENLDAAPFALIENRDQLKSELYERLQKAASG